MEKHIKWKEFRGERELRGRTEEKGKEQLGLGWKKQNKTHLFVSFNWIRITPEENDDLKYQKEKQENEWKICDRSYLAVVLNWHV